LRQAVRYSRRDTRSRPTRRRRQKIVVVIPAYKAAATLPSVLARIPAAVHEQLYKILVVEDGDENVPRSTSAELLAKHPKIFYV
jgi:hypothetical protein